VLVLASCAADANILINTCRMIAQRYFFAYQEPMPVEQLVRSLCDTKQVRHNQSIVNQLIQLNTDVCSKFIAIANLPSLAGAQTAPPDSTTRPILRAFTPGVWASYGPVR
jgi:hypothetical protein